MKCGIYWGSVIHDRSRPKAHRFTYPYLAFLIDLDRAGAFQRKCRLLGWNRFNLFSFQDRDHIREEGQTARATVEKFVQSQGIGTAGLRIFLLTQLRWLGYVFNPVSFYFFVNSEGETVCAVVEVGNTFHERKYFFLGPDTKRGTRFWKLHTKHFYVSPFLALEDTFEFDIAAPDELLNICIHTHSARSELPREAAGPCLRTNLRGVRRELTDGELLRASLRYPFLTLRVILAIHWQALRLLRKGLPFHAKASNPHLQAEVYPDTK